MQVFLVTAANNDATGANYNCPCTNHSLCKRVSVQHEVELFGFGDRNYETFDWDAVTTIAWPTPDSGIVCKAHENNARVIMGAPANMPLTNNLTLRREWVLSTVATVDKHFYDGITFDYESPMLYNSSQADQYVAIVRETREELRKTNPYSQVSVCVAWSPDDIDGRAYNYKGLELASDLLYQMVYDTRSQIYGRCIASANSPLSVAQRGVQRYRDIGINLTKLVLGIPWYGYRYACHKDMKLNDSFCEIPLVPFRGVNCSDAAGSEVSYASIMSIFHNTSLQTSLRFFDESVKSPYFNYRDSANGQIYQFWYDDAESLKLKYDFALSHGLAGFGPFEWSDLDCSSTASPIVLGECKSMWHAVKSAVQEH
jgi:di-N-acetylchitobiase